MFAAEIRKRRVDHRSYSCWRWHLDKVFVRINGEMHYLWRAVDHEGDMLEVFATKMQGSQGYAQVSEARGETLWPPGIDCNRPASAILGSDEGGRRFE